MVLHDLPDRKKEKMKKDPGFEYVEEEIHLRPEFIPNDIRFSLQAHRESLERAWYYTWGSPKVTIMYIDTGCDLDHPDLQENMLYEDSLALNGTRENIQDSYSSTGHGTAATGIGCAIIQNGRDIAGVAGRGKFVVANYFRISYAQAFAWAAEHGIRVIEIASVHPTPPGYVRTGFTTYPDWQTYPRYILDPIEYWANATNGILSIPAGNSSGWTGGDWKDYPFKKHLFYVMAPNSWSSRGEFARWVAPGEVFTTVNKSSGATSGKKSGTSFAHPFVGASIALLLALNPTLTPEDFDANLWATGLDFRFKNPSGVYYTAKSINIGGVVQRVWNALTVKPPEPPFPVNLTPPVVIITSPTVRSLLYGSRTVTVTARDNVVVKRIELSGHPRSTSNLEFLGYTEDVYLTGARFTVDTTRLPDGPYCLHAFAYGDRGQEGQAGRVVVAVLNDISCV